MAQAKVVPGSRKLARPNPEQARNFGGVIAWGASLPPGICFTDGSNASRSEWLAQRDSRLLFAASRSGVAVSKPACPWSTSGAAMTRIRVGTQSRRTARSRGRPPVACGRRAAPDHSRRPSFGPNRRRVRYPFTSNGAHWSASYSRGGNVLPILRAAYQVRNDFLEFALSIHAIPVSDPSASNT